MKLSRILAHPYTNMHGNNNPFKFFWVDLEMSGLIPEKNQILEFACLLSDAKCTQFRDGPELIIHASKQHLDQMDEWCTKTHAALGLTQKCIDSTLTVQQAEQQVLEFLHSNGVKQGQLIMAGNSIHMDKSFIRLHMPRLCEFLHYRLLDVSTLKTLVQIHRPELEFKKKGSHRALDDIRESIGELQHYSGFLFRE